jgi:hypothetical protein
VAPGFGFRLLFLSGADNQHFVFIVFFWYTENVAEDILKAGFRNIYLFISDNETVVSAGQQGWPLSCVGPFADNSARAQDLWHPVGAKGVRAQPFSMAGRGHYR